MKDILFIIGFMILIFGCDKLPIYPDPIIMQGNQICPSTDGLPNNFECQGGYVECEDYIGNVYKDCTNFPK